MALSRGAPIETIDIKHPKLLKQNKFEILMREFADFDIEHLTNNQKILRLIE